jgi:Domain of unknown function (DUF4296)
MVPLMADVRLIEAALENRADNQKDSLSSLLYAELFVKHQVTRPIFDSAVKHMTYHPEYMEIVFKLVDKELEKREKELKLFTH